MRAIGIVLLGVLLSAVGAVADAGPQDRVRGPRAMVATFLMDISEDGKPISDTFELWSLQGTIAPRARRVGRSCRCGARLIWRVRRTRERRQ